MSARAVRRILAGLVGVVLSWPAAHFAMTRTWEMDPWELYGFAMYTVPHPRIQLEIRVTVDGRERPLHLAGSLREEVAAHTRLRTTLGRWVSDRDFARALLERHETWEAVTLVLHHWRLDRESARWKIDVERISVARDG